MINPMYIQSAPKLTSTTCTTEQHRAFDFLLGEWEVTTKGKNKPHAKSNITKHNNGCSIHEHYVTSTAYTGNSINFYDKDNHQWHQTWIDNSGSPLYLDGKFENVAMILSDKSNRITWSKDKQGRVNQIWETNQDDVKSWKIIFVGSYKRINTRSQ
jgi:hypothetical protein